MKGGEFFCGRNENVHKMCISIMAKVRYDTQEQNIPLECTCVIPIISSWSRRGVIGLLNTRQEFFDIARGKGHNKSWIEDWYVYG